MMRKLSSVLFLYLYQHFYMLSLIKSSTPANTTNVIKGDEGCVVFQFANIGSASFDIKYENEKILTFIPIIDAGFFIDKYKNRTTFTSNLTENIISFCINNVTIQDMGTYTTVVMNKSYAVILEVLVPVSGISMSSVAGDTNSYVIIENTTKQIECRTNPIKPHAVIKWYLSGRTIQNALNSTEPYGNSGLYVSISVISYIGNRSDDQKLLYCTAKNIDSLQSISSENKTLDIKYGPNSVYISPTNQTYTVLEKTGTIGRIECTANCKPNCSIKWRGPGLSGTDVSVLEIENITRNLAGIYRCNATNMYGSRTSNAITVIVQYAPSGNPIITQFPSGTIIKAGIINLTCSLYGGIPIAHLSLDCGSNVVNSSSNTEASYSVSFSVSKAENGKVCNCSATHPATGYNSKTQHRINVYFAPDKPLMINQSPSGAIDTGMYITLTCEVSGGNPLATLYWNCGSNITNATSSNTASYSSNFKVNSTYDGRNCTCSAKHIDSSYNAATNHTLIVYYPPSIPKIMINPKLPAFDGNITNAKCIVSDAGNPKYSILWKWNENALDAFNNETISIGPLTRFDNGGMVSCSVYNNYTQRYEIERQSNRTLDVEYFPIVKLAPSIDSKSITIIENKTFNVNCLVKGNPTPTAQWFHGDHIKSLLEGEQQLNLTFHQVNRRKKGRYHCLAISTSAKYGNLTKSDYIDLIVQYPPDININYIYNTEKEQDVAFICNATGIPANYTYTGWTQTYNGIVIRNAETLFKHTQNNNKDLTLSQLSFRDSGTYTCFANNGIHGVNEELQQSGSRHINIKGQPALIKRLPADDTFSTGRGGNITIDLEYISFPAITEAIWYNKSSNSPIETSERDNIEVYYERKIVQTLFYDQTVNVSDFAYHAVLKMEKLVEQFEGEYILVLRNGFKDQNVTVFVVISSKPDDPSNLNVTQTRSMGVTISWNRGYSGGHTQFFNISVYDNTGLCFTDRTNDNYTEITQIFTITELNPSTEYVIHLFSQNEIGQSNVIKMNATTEAATEVSASSTQGFPTGAVVGGVTGVVLACVVVTLIIYIKRRCYISEKDPKSTERKTLTNVNKTDEVEEDGLHDNILYESAGQNFTSKQGQSGAEYAVVTKNKDKFILNVNSNIQETSLYSEVVKKTQNGQKDKVCTNVESSKKMKKNENGKKRVLQEDVYENMAGKVENNPCINLEQPRNNTDRLMYADLVFNPSSNGPKFIHGIDDRTIYADVDTTQKIDPLPDSDEEETTENTK